MKFNKMIYFFIFSKPLFGVSNKDEEDEEDDDEDENDKTAPSLFETAAEYEAKRASTHPSANIQGDTSTGEEHEVTKFQVLKIQKFFFPQQKKIF